jgi:hypothetical protein
MEFKKYSSIENHYQQRFIDKFVGYFGSSLTAQPYISMEKIDGVNIRLLFTPGKEIRVGNRMTELAPGESFHDIWDTLRRYDKDLKKLQSYAEEINKPFVIFGELCGRGILNRLDYGAQKRITFFDLYVEEEYLTAESFIKTLTSLDLTELLPTYYIENSLQAALTREIPANSEGFVVKPYKEVFRLPEAARFILKYKAASFADKPPIVSKKEVDGQFLEYNKIFQQYFVQNRVLDLFAKYGPIQDRTCLAQYIRYLIDDATEAFLKDYPETGAKTLSQQERKTIFSVGGLPANLLKAYL